MNQVNVLGDVISIAAALVAFSFVLGIWRMVHAPSRLVLLFAMFYMVVTRVLILYAEADPYPGWIEAHRSVVILPQYILFAVAFGMTYFELRNFHFDIPKDSEDLDTQAKHLRRMEALRRDTDVTEEKK